MCTAIVAPNFFMKETGCYAFNGVALLLWATSGPDCLLGKSAINKGTVAC